MSKLKGKEKISRYVSVLILMVFISRGYQISIEFEITNIKVYNNKNLLYLKLYNLKYLSTPL